LIVRVDRAGLMTTVQDRGRWGYQARGVPVAGPMDLCAHRLANAIVGNDEGDATLEVTLTGPHLEFTDTRLVAVTGAEFDDVPAGTPFVVSPERPLKFGARRRGTRAYIAISGGIDVPVVLGSRATHLPSGMGGFEGRALRAGDQLPLGPLARKGPPKGEGRPKDERPPKGGRYVLSGSVTLRVLPGPQADKFVSSALEVLTSNAYRIHPNSNRVGYRLTGARLQHASGADVISDATPIGSVQVPASGEPILLMADRQTTGGYAKIATVIGADLSLAGQLAPGDEIRFVLCSRAEALEALRLQERSIAAAADER
jgi:antagonist of KipI